MRNPKTRDCIMQELINNAHDAISVLIFLAIPVVFQLVFYRFEGNFM